jgi:hypothetical protein
LSSLAAPKHSSRDTHFTEREFLIKRDIYLSVIDDMSEAYHAIERIIDWEKDLFEKNDHSNIAGVMTR